MAKFAESDRDQPYLLPPDLRDWIPPDAEGEWTLVVLACNCRRLNTLTVAT